MIYSNPEFIFLFLLSYLPFLLFPAKWRKPLLILSSCAFLAWAGILDLIIFLSTTLVGFGALKLCRLFPHLKKPITRAGIILLAGNLFVWKYLAWILTQLGGPQLEINLPLGISFFTLQGIAFLVDVYRGKVPQVDFLSFTLFQGFFAQLIAGPIARGKELMPQIIKLRTPTLGEISSGVSLFALGLFKKIAIADRVGPYVDKVYDNPTLFSTPSLWLAVLGFSIQIWADFSGYTDMARGIGKMFGIHLPQNFKAPFFSTSAAEFWRRWHITLSEWIRDYVYQPLALIAMRRSKLLFMFAIFFTMLLCGLWHGASWTMALFGIWHGALLVTESLLKRSVRHIPHSIRKPLGWSYCFLMISLGFVLFKSANLETALTIFKGLIVSDGIQSAGTGFSIWGATTLCFVIQSFSYCDLKTDSYLLLDRLRRLVSFHSPVFWGGLSGLLVSLSILLSLFMRLSQSLSGFIYLRF